MKNTVLVFYRAFKVVAVIGLLGVAAMFSGCPNPADDGGVKLPLIYNDVFLNGKNIVFEDQTGLLDIDVVKAGIARINEWDTAYVTTVCSDIGAMVSDLTVVVVNDTSTTPRLEGTRLFIKLAKLDSDANVANNLWGAFIEIQDGSLGTLVLNHEKETFRMARVPQKSTIWGNTGVSVTDFAPERIRSPRARS
jgi:hypothetical protein